MMSMTTPIRTTPVRLKLSRKKGFDLQAHSRAINGRDAVSVARPRLPKVPSGGI